MRWRTPEAPPRDAVPRGPQRRAAGGFTVTIIGAVAFGWAYWTDADVRWQGASLAAALVGLAYGFAAWAAMLPQGPYVEKRESMKSPSPEVNAVADDLGQADGSIVSAPLPRRVLTLALGFLAVAFVLPLRSLLGLSLGPDPELKRTAWGNGVLVVREDGTPVRIDELAVGTALTVYPQGHTTDGDVGVMLLRVPPEQLELPAERAAWTVDGVIGYSKICTHAGCPVGLFAQGTGELLCPCHQSVFDAYRGAKPRYGPAARPLPQLPLGLAADGATLVARGDFPTPPGPGFWRTS